MISIIIIVSLIVLAISAIINLKILSKKRIYKAKVISSLITIVLITLFIIFPVGFYQVDTGEAVVVKEYGTATEVKTSGLHWRFWPKETIEKYDLKTHETKQSFEAYSLDAQTMTANLTVQFKAKVDELLQINYEFGSLEVLESRLTSIASEKAKVVLSTLSAMNIIETRSTLSIDIQSKIEEAFTKYHISVVNVVIEDIAFNDAFETAVEQKMIAEQQKLQAQYDKEKAIIKAEEQLEVAKKEAEAILEKAKAEAQAQIEISSAEAEKIKLKSIEIARMLGFTITEDGFIDYSGKSDSEIKLISDYLKYLEYISTWDGKLPTVVGDSTAIYIPNPTN